MRSTDKHTGLTAESLRELLHYDPQTGIFTWRVTRGNLKACSRAGSMKEDGYIRVCIGERRYHAHRLAWLYVTGDWPVEEIDHINRNKADNRFTNLRPATRSTNEQNRRWNVNITAEGLTLCITEWARRKGIPVPTLKYRIQKGWPIDRALNKPPEVNHAS